MIVKKMTSFAFCFAIPKQMIHHIADGMKERGWVSNP